MVRGVRLGLPESDQPVLCCPGEPPVLRMWKEKDDSLDSFLPNKATARMVETTSYALLTSLQYGSVSYCNPIVSWLSDEQRYGGGFYSTQDTVIALEALTEYTLLAKRSSLDMVINAAYRRQGDLQRFELTQAKPLAKPVEVTKADDVTVSTGSSQGVSVVNLASGVDQLIADYAVEDGRVVIQLEYIPADQYLCVGFRVQELFKTGMASPALFKVFEFHAPGLDRVRKETVVTFIKKATCSDVNLQEGKHYLIMGKEGMLSVENMQFKYTYPLDPLSWIEFWPSEEDCNSQACSNFLKIMQTFSEDFLIFGCTDI
ncbi:UNVERIFIED_CONTAM: hypothetical protein FKN15_010604 [Acipenser sinensis]